MRQPKGSSAANCSQGGRCTAGRAQGGSLVVVPAERCSELPGSVTPHGASMRTSCRLVLVAFFFSAALTAAHQWSGHRVLVSYFPGRDDCKPYYRPLAFGQLALVVNCQWSMGSVQSVLAELRTASRRAILSDSFIESRTPADMAIYREYKDVIAAYYAVDEPLYGAITAGNPPLIPSELNAVIDTPAWQKRVDDKIAEVGRRIALFKSISNETDTPESHVPVIVNEAKPIMNWYDGNFNVHGNNRSMWSNYTLGTVEKMHSFQLDFFEKLGSEIDIYGFDWYDSVNVTDNSITIASILGGLQQMPKAEKHRYLLFPFAIKDDYNSSTVTSSNTMDRSEFEMNSAIFELAMRPHNKVSLLMMWVGTPEFSGAETIIDGEAYLNATPPASFTITRNIGEALDRATAL